MTTSSSNNRLRAALLSVAALAGVSAVPMVGVLVVASEAHAVVGRPLTPVSYAGVARRSSRRVARRTAARTTAAMGVATLPPGCGYAAGFYTCGAVRYQQVIDGGNVVYVVVD